MLLRHDPTSQLLWLEFSLFSGRKHLSHASFTKLSGASKPPFQSLNVSFRQGDSQEDVSFNRTKIVYHFQVTSKTPTVRYVDMEQIHGTTCLSIRSEQDIDIVSKTPCDALITNQPGVLLSIQHADCQPIILYSPEKKVIAALHAGWRGICQEIISKTIQTLQQEWNVSPSTLLAGIGPSIGPSDCEFLSWQKDLPERLHDYVTKETAYIDLWQASIDELKQCGLQERHIECSFLSTYSLPALFFSYRRENITGRNATCIMLH